MINKFDATQMRVSLETKLVYVGGLTIDGKQTFAFDIWCKQDQGTSFFFDIKQSRMLIVLGRDIWTHDKTITAVHKCAMTSFSIFNDRPIPAVKWIYEQDAEIDKIAEDFKDKYAAYLLDCIINRD